MDGENISQALMIGVSTFLGVLVISAVIIFFNSSLEVVKSAGSGIDFGQGYRSDIEALFLKSGSGNYIKGTDVINLMNYYVDNVNITISISNVKFINSHGNVEVLPHIGMDTTVYDERKIALNQALKYLMDNQDFTIDVQTVDSDLGSKIITIIGV